jgi:hypothetical protein
LGVLEVLEAPGVGAAKEVLEVLELLVKDMQGVLVLRLLLITTLAEEGVLALWVLVGIAQLQIVAVQEPYPQSMEAQFSMLAVAVKVATDLLVGWV